MRTPGHDDDLVRGFLFNEQIIQNLDEIEKIESIGDKVGEYKIQNKILITLNNSKNINISKIKRDFLTNSSCGVCGKTSLDALEIIKKVKTSNTEPKLTKETIIQSPSILRQNQSEFSKTGGIHASGLFSSEGKLISLREDVGRHNALDKLIGNALIKNQIQSKNQFITCSGRLNFELVQKVLMTNIGLMIGVGAPTSLAIDLANRFDMTLIGFVKEDSFNIYTNNQKVIVN
jgi:FdhD protein